MRIAIDARLNAYRQGGIPQYTRQLMTALAEVAREEQIISLQHRDHIRPLAVAPNVLRRTLLTPPHHRFEPWSLPLELLLARADVLHFPDFIAPLRRPAPAVVTIHDLAFLHYPEILDDAARAYYGQVTRTTEQANAVIAVSEATRQDIAQYLDIPIEQIDVIYEAAAPVYSRLELRPGEARVLNATPVTAKSFMLFVSTLEPRKNLPTLLRALRICIDRRPERPYRLVIAGARGWRDDEIFETVRTLRLGDYVLFTGSVGQYDLRWLYNACRCYINPSLYEGFGLPLLEAMVCGAPCLAAATSSLPEIGGDAAIYLPPLDAGLWAEAIEEIWDDEERQQELGRLGQARAQQFSWTRAARETLRIYNRVVEQVRHPTGAPAPRPHETRPIHDAGDNNPAMGPTIALAPADLAEQTRGCPRCGARLRAGQLPQGITIEQEGVTAAVEPLRSYAWVCPECEHVVLAIEPAEGATAQPSATAIPDAAPAPTSLEAGGETAEPDAAWVTDESGAPDIAEPVSHEPDAADETAQPDAVWVEDGSDAPDTTEPVSREPDAADAPDQIALENVPLHDAWEPSDQRDPDAHDVPGESEAPDHEHPAAASEPDPAAAYAKNGVAAEDEALAPGETAAMAVNQPEAGAQVPQPADHGPNATSHTQHATGDSKQRQQDRQPRSSRPRIAPQATPAGSRPASAEVGRDPHPASFARAPEDYQEQDHTPDSAGQGGSEAQPTPRGRRQRSKRKH